MRFDVLHGKFSGFWKTIVKANEWQMPIIHLIFLSQYLGSTPTSDPIKPRDLQGMRALIGGKAMHPRLHYFIVQECLRGDTEIWVYENGTWVKKAIENLPSSFMVRSHNFTTGQDEPKLATCSSRGNKTIVLPNLG